MNTTYSTNGKKLDSITFDDILEASRKIKPIPTQRMEMCKKHYKILSKELKKIMPPRNNISHGVIGDLYGIPIVIKPHLKKIRMYTSSSEY